MEYKEKQIISKLQKMPEKEMIKEIIIPLLESLGYLKVESYHGTIEKGKDILCWELDKFDEIKLTVAQVKHFKFTNIASDSRSLQTVFNQLIACFTRHLPFSDKSTHLPEKALLISTYEIDTKTLETRLSDHPILWDNRVKIIDGLKLASLLIKKKPDILNKIMGVEVDIYSSLEPSLNNEILLKALGYYEKKAIKNIYTDIDFSLGKITTQLFFNTSFKPEKNLLTFDNKDWETFKNNCLTLKNEFGLEFLSNTIEESEAKIIPLIKDYKKWKNELQYLRNELKTNQDKLNNLIQMRNDFVKEHKFKEEEQKSIINNQIKEKYDTKLLEIKTKISTKENTIIKIEKKISEHKKKEYKPRCEISLDGNILVNKIKEKRDWIEKKVAEYNKQRPCLEEIRDFIIKCKNIIDCANILFSDSNFSENLFESKQKFIRSNFESTRFKLPIEQAFDTGLNITVLGEAGAGKTTCLQMYSINKQKDASRLFIYLPLSRVIQNWHKTDKQTTDNDKYQNLDVGIAKYLSNNGVSITVEEFQVLISSRKIVLLLDGIDEAIKTAPWMIKGISFLAEKFKENVQVIVTSRMSGSYLDEIPFFTITLLPFTDEQRNYFIDMWFGPKRKDIVVKIKKHLKNNKAINEIVKNPLLTTILCVLAENDLPLPNTELKLYNDRLKLLTGYFDNVKNIVTRISTPPHTLELMAQKLAFYLHSNGKQEEDLFELQKLSVNLMLNKLSINNSKRALNELIDPCNILVPMTEDGKFGFGHLRYQEHLAAKEIMNNRGINIVPFLKQSWWRSVLILFARMSDDLTWLIHELGQKKQITDTKEALLAMINVRLKNEQYKIKSLLKRYLMLEGYDLAYDDDEEI